MTLSGRVDPTPATAPRVGTLLQSANVRVNGADTETNSDGDTIRWVEGFTYKPEVCDAGVLIDPCDELTGDDVLDGYEQPGNRTVRPFVITVVDECSTFGNPDSIRGEREAIARRALEACQSKRVEEELWSGAQTVAAHDTADRNRYLTDDNDNVTRPEGTLKLGAVTALMVLERALGDCVCGRGMIHARPDTVTLWRAHNLVHREGDLIVTDLGTIVVAGRGYSGAGPEGLSPGSADGAWAYATSIVEVRLGAFIPLDQQVVRASNILLSYAARPAAVTWGCCQIGVRVDHSDADGITVTGS